MSRLNTLWNSSVDKTLCGMLQYVERSPKVNLDSIPCKNCNSCYLHALNTSVFDLWESIDVET